MLTIVYTTSPYTVVYNLFFRCCLCVFLSACSYVPCVGHVCSVDGHVAVCDGGQGSDPGCFPE